MIRLRHDELAIDNFAGGGGASTGIEAALGRPVDIAINHNPAAIAMHEANHPGTRHYCEDIWEVDPREACGSRPVGLAWFSPDCTHFSRAKGGKPVKKEIRGLAWVVLRWAREVAPRVILLENVQEFRDWGPLDEDNRPIKDQKGETFRAWCAALTDLGYQLEFRLLVAADYGTPTTRKRLFLIARRDLLPIVWPEATHGESRSLAWRPAAEVIDWTRRCPSIFTRKRPLAEATQRRIALGIQRYVIETADPFIIPLTHQGAPRTYDIREPLRTVTAAHRGEFALVAAFLTKFYGTAKAGADVRNPLPTVTAGGGKGGGHIGEVRAFLTKFYGKSTGLSLHEPLHTVTGKSRFGLVTVAGEDYAITDIGMRMLQPHELFAAQGFPAGYIINPEFKGKPLTKTDQIALAGNSVCPQVAAALVTSNIGVAA